LYPHDYVGCIYAPEYRQFGFTHYAISVFFTTLVPIVAIIVVNITIVYKLHATSSLYNTTLRRHSKLYELQDSLKEQTQNKANVTMAHPIYEMLQ
jgi:hypothetical protein